MRTIKIKEEELRDKVEELIKETKEAGVWQGWKMWLRFNPETEEFDFTDFLSQGTFHNDNCIDILAMESWSVMDNNSEVPDYIFDAYDEIHNTKVDRENTNAYDLMAEDERVENLTLELVTEDYDISEMIGHLTDVAIVHLEENGFIMECNIEFV